MLWSVDFVLILLTKRTETVNLTFKLRVSQEQTRVNVVFKNSFFRFQKSSGMDVLKKRVQYRTLQYLGILQNEIVQKVILTSALAVSTFTQACCSALFVFIYNSPDHWLELAMIVLILANSVPVSIILMGGLARVSTTSKKTLQVVRKETVTMFSGNRSRIKAENRFLRSCSCIKVRFGDLNFVDQTTPLNCIDFSTNLTVQFLLLQKKL